MICNYPGMYCLCCRILRDPRHFVTSACLRCAAAWMLYAAGEQMGPCASIGPHFSHRRWLISYCVGWQLKVRRGMAHTMSIVQDNRCNHIVIVLQDSEVNYNSSRAQLPVKTK